ncbi:MAG: F0F1 ATP synthase subunit B [Gammaproteobacteria bacterium]|nr:F0F1 ATP synthase subunit B [Gammaproteobacteria bacterium]
MGLNATLLGQIITFLLFVWFTKKFVWPPVMQAMDERRQKIADGLAAAERGLRELEQADVRVGEVIKEARKQAASIVDQASKRGSEIVEEAKATARTEGERLVAAAQAEIERDQVRAREALRSEVAGIAVAGAGRILKREINAAAHADLMDELTAQI